ncbi:MAG TPA: neutral/alkaline non-lysosomal ceramidase N-terminal domain-containing protein, partial [Methylomirabilota bacterium]|nr:neutral/alkaline non-lysosomal ceramidase N-terminal domain-containing protein [Methylomirabilota bacterium]
MKPTVPSIMCIVRLIAFAFVCLPLSAVDASRAEPPLIGVGVAQVDITPGYPVRLSGFGFRRDESEGVTQRIYAKALAFENKDAGPAILITADNLCVPDEITREVAKRLEPKIGLKLERLTITATHTHTAPMLKDVCPTIFGTQIPEAHQTNINRYTEEFTDALEKVALEAHKAIRPSRLFWGKGKASFAVNRRTKGGPVDHDLPTLVVRDADGKVRAVYFSYACHCVTLSGNLISGDWAGFAQHTVQEMYPGAIALASVGCGADSNPASGVTGTNVTVCKEQGDQIANEVKRIVEAGMLPLSTSPAVKYSRVDLPFAAARSRQEWEERAKRNDAVGHHARLNLARLDRGETLPTKFNYPIQSWIFGEELAIVFLPGETVVDYSLRLKREFDRRRLWVNGYSNDGRAYIPSERILKEGGYEGGDAMVYYDFPQIFAPGLEQKILDSVHAQLPPSYRAQPGTEGSRPLPPSEALKTFRTKPGLEVQLVAAEPLVQSPVAIDWGADGRLWVCEMNDYPSGMDNNWQPGGRVKFLRDTNADGRYDHATVFLEDIPFPTGITAWGRGLFVCAAPDVLYAQDTNGDGKADKVERVFTGFFTDNFQARVNSLSLGMDNWIYAANGLLGGIIETLPNSLFSAAGQKVDIRNRDFRFHPASGVMEPVSGLTQQGRARDDWGNWFGCDNSQLLLHYAGNERYSRRNPHVISGSGIRNLVTEANGNRIYPTSETLERFNDLDHVNRVTSACGLGIYRDTLLGEEFYANSFTCEAVHNLVHRRVIEGDATITSRQAEDETSSEFLTSTDNWFRPAQARPGPDGALYIADMYRFLIEHPRWIPAARLSKIDIRAGADKGRIYRVVKKGAELRPIRDLTGLDATHLAAALDTPNGIERDRVHIEILTRKATNAAPGLRKLASGSTLPQVRVQALAALEGLDGITPEVIESALKDRDPRIREHAIRVAEPFLKADEQFLSKLRPLASDDSPLVARQLAHTLGESHSKDAADILAALLKKWSSNTEVRNAVLSSALPHAAPLLEVALQIADANLRNEWVNPLLATVLHSSNPNAFLLAFKAALPESGKADLRSLAIILTALEQRQMELSSVLPPGSGERKRFESALEMARNIALHQSAAAADRHAAIALLSLSDAESDLETLTQLARSPDGQRQAALQALKRRANPTVARALLDNWKQTSPAARMDVLSLLVERDVWASALLEAIKSGTLDRAEVSLSQRTQLRKSDNAQVRSLTDKLFPEQVSAARDHVITKYKAAIGTPGVPARGAEVFAQSCAACHALNGTGRAVGPDLATLRQKDTEYWLKNILDPNAVIEPRFVSYEVELKDGRSLSGVIQSESANHLVLVSGSGLAETLPRGQIT